MKAVLIFAGIAGAILALASYNLRSTSDAQEINVEDGLPVNGKICRYRGCKNAVFFEKQLTSLLT